MQTVTIPLKLYVELQDAAHVLNAYERGGVDNWNWCYESMKDFFDDEWQFSDPYIAAAGVKPEISVFSVNDDDTSDDDEDDA